VSLTNGKTYRIALFLVDWDTTARTVSGPSLGAQALIEVKLRESLAAFGLPARSGVIAISTACVPDCDAARALLAEAYGAGLERLSAGTVN